MRVSLLAYTQLNPDSGTLPEALRPSVEAGSAPEPDAPERLVEYAGRVCYRSTDKLGLRPGFVTDRVAEGHESIIEHLSFTFLVEGISRACSHQLVRHRLASYSQESQRYCEMGRSAADPPAQESNDEQVMPPAVADDPLARAAWRAAVEDLTEAYETLRRLGIRKEDARFLLPNATATRIVVTQNARSLRHFFQIRLHRSAQWEIRAVAREMLQLVYPLAPSVFGDLHRQYGG